MAIAFCSDDRMGCEQFICHFILFVLPASIVGMISNEAVHYWKCFHYIDIFRLWCYWLLPRFNGTLVWFIGKQLNDSACWLTAQTDDSTCPLYKRADNEYYGELTVNCAMLTKYKHHVHTFIYMYCETDQITCGCHYLHRICESIRPFGRLYC